MKKSDYRLEKTSGNVSYFDIINGGSLAKTVQNKNILKTFHIMKK